MKQLLMASLWKVIRCYFESHSPFLDLPLLCYRLTILSRYSTILFMIKSFRCKHTEKIWNRVFTKKFPPDIQGAGKSSPIARRKLLMLNAASTLEDLKIPPSNRLEKLSGNRKGHFLTRINNQWRICFKFENGDAFEVEIVDYH